MQSERKNDRLHAQAILKGIFDCYSPATGFDWGTAIALGVIGVFLGASVFMTVRSDMGYVVDAFT